MADFVDPRSVVRRIWGDADAILLVFAGSAAEFALNRAVDWLFFTGAIPNDPVRRLFSTAAYAQQIVFADRATAQHTLERIRAAHGAVEGERGASIPQWAHRDVLYMLIHYSERAFELLERRLTAAERDELYAVFWRVGEGLGVRELPPTYAEWRVDRRIHLERDLARSEWTDRLYAAYRRDLGAWRYEALLRVQGLLVPKHVRRLLGLDAQPLLRLAMPAYRVATLAGLRPLIRSLLMPAEHLPQVQRLDHPTALA